MKQFKTLKSYILYILVACTFTLTSCERDYPKDVVSVGNSALIIYKAEKLERLTTLGNKYRYAVKDASAKGWTLFSAEKYNVGDTLRISNAP